MVGTRASCQTRFSRSDLSLGLCLLFSFTLASTASLQAESLGSKATARELKTLLGHVTQEFKPWQITGITKEMVERSYCIERWTGSMRFQIKDGKLFASFPDHRFQSRERTALFQMIHLSQKYRLPDVDLLLVTDDFCPQKNYSHRSHDGNFDRCPLLAPYLTLGKLVDENHCIAIPDFTFQGWPEQFLPAWSLTRALLKSAAENQPWEQRSKTLFWKGANTHPSRSFAVHSKKLRQSYLTRIDFVDYADQSSSFVSLADHCHHKYLLNQEGYSYSSRLKYLMACGSAVIYSDMRFREFWYHMLDETNHLPVDAVTASNDGEPVLKGLQALMANDTKARELGRNAQYLATEILHSDNVDRYLLEVLQQYHKLMTFEVEVHPDVLPIEMIILRPDTVLEAMNRTCTHC